MTAADDANKVAGLLKRVGQAPAAVNGALRVSAFEGLAKVKANASGRPGPRRVTGDYTRTMTVTERAGPKGSTFTIGTNAAQALRLEFGFNGTDRRGRHYSQRPLPHWRPMFEWLQPRVTARVTDALDRLTR